MEMGGEADGNRQPTNWPETPRRLLNWKTIRKRSFAPVPMQEIIGILMH